MSLAGNADDILPYFIAYHLPIGVKGLVVAAIFAAAMSGLDSGINSITAVVLTDLLDRFGYTPKTEKRHLLVSRLLALSIGSIVILGSSFMQHIPGNITMVTSKTTDLLVAPLFGLFFFALFVPFARPCAVWLGWLSGVTTAMLIAFSGNIFGFDPVTGYDPVSFMWIGPVSLLINISVGIAASFILNSAFPRTATNTA
jgi:SSS family solute:Na+ symporter